MKVALLAIVLTEALSGYLHHFLRNYPARLERALSYIPLIVKNSHANQIDPLLVGITISCESSWRPNIIGPIGEKGLMQVHGMAAVGFDLTDPLEQIKAGIRWLGKCHKACDGDVLQAINAYGTGKCKPVQRFAIRRFRLYKKWAQK